MKLVATGALCVLLIAALGFGGVFAKKLPTYKTLEERYMASMNGFQGELATAIEDIPEENAPIWDACVKEYDIDTKQLARLGQELEIILQYYQITEGSEESLDNFDKWQKDFNEHYPKTIKEVRACYDKKLTPTLPKL